jgi:hypothetical protein
MSDFVNSANRPCTDHDVRACMLCMVDNFHAWLDDLRAWRRRQRLKAERRAMTVEGRFDLGGEG